MILAAQEPQNWGARANGTRACWHVPVGVVFSACVCSSFYIAILILVPVLQYGHTGMAIFKSKYNSNTGMAYLLQYLLFIKKKYQVLQYPSTLCTHVYLHAYVLRVHMYLLQSSTRV